MKATLYDGSRRVLVDTKQDTCLFCQNHKSPQSGNVQIYEKDLYMHRNQSRQPDYYFHIHPAGNAGREKVILVSPLMAERFLLRVGISCTEFPDSEPISRLYNWGYGIAEEF
jgi:hypothetical protein